MYLLKKFFGKEQKTLFTKYEDVMFLQITKNL